MIRVRDRGKGKERRRGGPSTRGPSASTLDLNPPPPTTVKLHSAPNNYPRSRARRHDNYARRCLRALHREQERGVGVHAQYVHVGTLTHDAVHALELTPPTPTVPAHTQTS